MVQKLGKYQITEKLGEGSMGAVYKAYDEVLDRYVAIKTMASDIQWDQELKQRFYREARSAAALHHPNIVTIHDLGEENKIPFIVMELLTGRDLKSIIRDKTPLTLEEKLKIMAQVSEGLGHAHSNQIIHRDIKPGNIYVSRELNVKILDFGIAHIPSSNLTRAGARLGTPFYMSPEQIRGADCDERSDIFSAGIVFYELLAYAHPFLAKDMVKTMENIVFQPPLPFGDQLPGAPPDLRSILDSCLEKDLNKRCRRMEDVGQQCRQLLEKLSAESKRMQGELKSMMPGIQLAIDQRKASSALQQLFNQSTTLLAQDGTPDFIALNTLHSQLSREWQPEPPVPQKPAAISHPTAPVMEETEKTQILPSFAELAKKMEPPSPAKAAAKYPVPPEPAPIPAAPKPAEQPSMIPPKPVPASEAPRKDEAAAGGTPAVPAAGDEIHKRQEAFSLVARAQELQIRKDFDAAISLLESALKIFPMDPPLVSLLDQARKAKADAQKLKETPPASEPDKGKPSPVEYPKPAPPPQPVQMKEKPGPIPYPESKGPSEFEKPRRKEQEPSLETGDETSVQENPPKRKQRKLLVGIAVAAVVFIVAGLSIFLVLSRKPKQADLTPQLNLAKASLSQNLYDKAIAASEQVLAVSPGNAEASEILRQAREKKKLSSIDTLMLEAQNFRAQNQPEVAARVLKKILEMQPDYNPALSVLSQLEAEASANKSKEEQDKAVQDWIDKSTRLLSSGKINEANAEIDKIARLRPNAPELIPLKKKLKEAAARAQKARDEAQKQVRSAEYQRKASDLFSQGKYDEALPVLNELLKDDAQNAQAIALRNQIGHAQTALKEAEAAISQRKFDDALNAASQLQKINSTDPNIATLRKRIDEARASARATLSVFRLAESGTLFFDDQQIGTGELENRAVPIGRHRLSIKSAQGKQSVINLDLADGQKIDFVYDAAIPEIRYFASADRAVIEKRKVREEVHSYQVEHNHGMLRGKCKGVLSIGGIMVSFKTSESDHSFNYRFEMVKMARSKDHLELSMQDNKKFTFKLADEAKAEEASRAWDKLRLAKD